ncbi:GNAT family N-acetyltransferase [bacterium]|nr:GNAT family N-acetyltransferase [candidate division CSSED10-310 bacterium]
MHSLTRSNLYTERLTLRPFTAADAPSVKRLAGEKEIAANTLLIPHPYKDKMAEQWIETHARDFLEDRAAVFAITIRETKELTGAISLNIIREDEKAELGYWIGKPYWNRGYCTEAAARILGYGFRELKLNRIYAVHFLRNPASGRVLEKIGMVFEGCLRQSVKKWDRFEDLHVYGILAKDYFRETKERKPEHDN